MFERFLIRNCIKSISIRFLINFFKHAMFCINCSLKIFFKWSFPETHRNSIQLVGRSSNIPLLRSPIFLAKRSSNTPYTEVVPHICSIVLHSRYNDSVTWSIVLESIHDSSDEVRTRNTLYRCRYYCWYRLLLPAGQAPDTSKLLFVLGPCSGPRGKRRRGQTDAGCSSYDLL